MPTAFITRDLAPDSYFRRILAAQGWQVAGQSLVLLTPLPFRSVPPCEWIFFSSQNAVRWFFEQAALLPDWTAERARAVRWAAIGEATARALAGHVDVVDFVGTGEPVGTAAGFRATPPPAPPPTGGETRHTLRRTLSRGACIVPPPVGGGVGGGVDPGPLPVLLLPAALHSEKTLLAALQPDFQCIHLPVYDNQPLPDPPSRTDDVLVFTSPMNVQAYFAQHHLQGNQRAVAIGRTTAAALAARGVSEIWVASEATEAGLAEAVLRTGWGRIFDPQNLKPH